MRTPPPTAFLLAATAMALAGCGQNASQSVLAGTGPDPVLPPPQHSFIPTVSVSPVQRWPQGAKPTAAPGLQVEAYASGLDHPRWLYVLPNGDVLVAETNAPPKPEDGKGIKGWVYKKVQAYAGAGTPSANRITLLRDSDGDGVVDSRSVFLDGLKLALRHDPRRQRLLRRRHRRGPALSLQARRDQDHRARYQGHRPSRRSDQPSLDQERHCQPRRQAALRDRGLQQQRRRERHRGRARPGGYLGGRPDERALSRLRVRPAQTRTAWAGLR